MAEDTFLQKILSSKRKEIVSHQDTIPLTELEAQVKTTPFPFNLSGALMGEKVRLIAEVKKASPSKGLLATKYDPALLASTYCENGAAAVSVLTETDFFQGSLAHLRQVKASTEKHRTPILRKDFLLDPYQLFEARANGADAALLIVAALDETLLGEMLSVAKSIWLQCVVEVHNYVELEIALKYGAEIIGINNRDLKTFEVNTNLAIELRPYIPAGKIIIAESGINSSADVSPLKKQGINAILVGEALMKADNIALKVQELAGV